jgi:hypothetical protein
VTSLSFFDVYVLKLLRLETFTFSDAMLSDINVVLCYVLSLYSLDNSLSCHWSILFCLSGCRINPQKSKCKGSSLKVFLRSQLAFFRLYSPTAVLERRGLLEDKLSRYLNKYPARATTFTLL